jgi:gliding motility-associated-like protein
MKYLIFVILLLYNIFGYAQTNYIYNSNLNDYDTRYCDVFHFLGFGDSIVSNWSSPNLATIDYYNSCESTNFLSIPYNLVGTIFDPSSLDGYIGIVNYIEPAWWNEYVRTNLRSSLSKDSTYRLTFKIYSTNGTVNTNFGVCFEKDSIFRNIDTIISTQYPEYTYMSDNIIEKGKWETLEFKITPQIDSLQYLLFGYFPHEKTLLIDSTNYIDTLPKATYFLIDDIYLIKDTIDLVLNTCAIALPDAFTPNADGLNDEWKPLIHSDCTADIDNYLLRIFNRWGEVVFTSHDKNETWKGINNEIGTYVYYLQYDDRGKIQIKQGNVELIR